VTRPARMHFAWMGAGPTRVLSEYGAGINGTRCLDLDTRESSRVGNHPKKRRKTAAGTSSSLSPPAARAAKGTEG